MQCNNANRYGPFYRLFLNMVGQDIIDHNRVASLRRLYSHIDKVGILSVVLNSQYLLMQCEHSKCYEL